MYTCMRVRVCVCVCVCVSVGINTCIRPTLLHWSLLVLYLSILCSTVPSDLHPPTANIWSSTAPTAHPFLPYFIGFSSVQASVSGLYLVTLGVRTEHFNTFTDNKVQHGDSRDNNHFTNNLKTSIIII